MSVEPNTPEAVAEYVTARQASNAARTAAATAAAAANTAELDMQTAWRNCKNAPPGVYLFDTVAVVVDPLRDYPEVLPVLPQVQS